MQYYWRFFGIGLAIKYRCDILDIWTHTPTMIFSRDNALAIERKVLASHQEQVANCYWTSLFDICIYTFVWKLYLFMPKRDQRTVPQRLFYPVLCMGQRWKEQVLVYTGYCTWVLLIGAPVVNPCWCKLISFYAGVVLESRYNRDKRNIINTELGLLLRFKHLL